VKHQRQLYRNFSHQVEVGASHGCHLLKSAPSSLAAFGKVKGRIPAKAPELLRCACVAQGVPVCVCIQFFPRRERVFIESFKAAFFIANMKRVAVFFQFAGFIYVLLCESAHGVLKRPVAVSSCG
jgi:hypothetical protein